MATHVNGLRPAREQRFVEKHLKQLKVAVIGLSGVGAEYLSAVQSDDQFALVAVADTDAGVLRRHTEGAPFCGYTDYRSLVVETARTGLDLLVTALEPFQSVDYLGLAAERGIAVFHKAPFARSVAEGERLVHKFDAAACPLVVSRPWQFEPAFSRLHRIDNLAGRVYAATAVVRTPDDSTGWRGDSARAAAGVLLNGAYEQVDMLVHLMGVPEYVNAQCSMAVAPGKARSYDTEDAALVSMRFAGERIASIAASRNASEHTWGVTLIGEGGSVDLSPERMVLQPRAAGPRECLSVKTRDRVGPAISAFGAALLAGIQDLPSMAKEHLVTLATIEAAYLSAKTGTPEAPDRFLSARR
jgi:predicted dehydrogenase